jgi:hypothetical protein
VFCTTSNAETGCGALLGFGAKVNDVVVDGVVAKSGGTI